MKTCPEWDGWLSYTLVEDFLSRLVYWFANKNATLTLFHFNLSQKISKAKQLWKERRGHRGGCELRSWTFSLDHKQSDYWFLYFLLFCITDAIEYEVLWKVLREVLFSSVLWPEDFNLNLQKLISLELVLSPGRFSLTTAVALQTLEEKYDEWKEWWERTHHLPLFVFFVLAAICCWFFFF